MVEKNGALPRRAAVLGWPVSHSLSPLIHSTWAAREGISVRYEAIAVEPADAAFREQIKLLRAAGYAGVNVTLPHKECAYSIADNASEAAKAIGAANMLTFGSSGIFAENSDAAAVIGIIEGLETPPKTAIILGAGGVARAALWALKRSKVSRVMIANRTRSRADEISAIGNADVIDWDGRNEALDKADFIVNATSLGMTGQSRLEIDPTAIRTGAAVFDTVYSPLETALLKEAKARGATTIDGLEMLMRQAVPAYLAWLGAKAAVDKDLRQRLEAAIKARAS